MDIVTQKDINTVLGVLLMAGKGTRMKSDMPKVLHCVCGKPLGFYPLQALKEAGLEKRLLVVGHQARDVKKTFPDEKACIQKPQKGTGHAVMICRDHIPRGTKHVLIMNGDLPLTDGFIVKELVRSHVASNSPVTILVSRVDEAPGYGRVIRDEWGNFQTIIEEKDWIRNGHSFDPYELPEYNAGLYCFEKKTLFRALDKIKPNNAQKEYYLTDAVHRIKEQGGDVNMVLSDDPDYVLQVSRRTDLPYISAVMRLRKIERLCEQGIEVDDPATCYVEASVEIGDGTRLLPGVCIEGNTKIGPDCIIGPNCRLVDVEVGEGTSITFTQAVEAKIGKNCQVGPFANLRPGTVLDDDVKIGNFVEVKNSTIGKGSKANHLTYLGDADVGKKCNIGAGTITCNYDGYKKHRTTIDDEVFIGSDTILVAPVKIGRKSYTAAGSAITDNVPPNSIAFGRAKQVNKKRKKGKK
jgi:bifunctional UDP-N-acetylglucosamine pyrophosphorylase/glucosamine-1-phosphate N-acetyltransferase